MPCLRAGLGHPIATVGIDAADQQSLGFGAPANSIPRERSSERHLAGHNVVRQARPVTSLVGLRRRRTAKTTAVRVHNEVTGGKRGRNHLQLKTYRDVITGDIHDCGLYPSGIGCRIASVRGGIGNFFGQNLDRADR